jgi:hypothetical protein
LITLSGFFISFSVSLLLNADNADDADFRGCLLFNLFESADFRKY